MEARELLTINVAGDEWFDEATSTFKQTSDSTLQLEHSLVSISRWESKWHTPYLYDKEPKTAEMWLDYVRCMTVNRNVDPTCYDRLTESQFRQIYEYIQDPMTATTVKDKGHGSRGIVTSERIYAWMTEFGIPFECEKWHLNRLLTLIRVCNAAQIPPKKMKKSDVMRQNQALNAARRRKSGG